MPRNHSPSRLLTAITLGRSSLFSSFPDSLQLASAGPWCTPAFIQAAAAAKSLQSCPTLWDPRDGGPPGSPVPGILQARTLEWVAISFSNAWKWKVKVRSLNHVRLLATPWTAAHQAPPSMGIIQASLLFLPLKDFPSLLLLSITLSAFINLITLPSDTF